MELITIIADSLAMPRPEINAKDIYAYKLGTKLFNKYQIVNNAHRGNSSLKSADFQELTGYFIEDIKYYKESKFYILHLGIVDCAPRLFSESESKLLSKIRPAFVRSLIIKYKSKYRLFFTKYFPKVYVPIQQFSLYYEYLINYIINNTSCEKIFIINIADTTQLNKNKSYNFEQNIKLYNSEIFKICDKFKSNVHIIDMYNLTNQNQSLLLDDGIHITKEAHSLIANMICQKIDFFETL